MKRTNRKTIVHITQHRKLKNKQHELTNIEVTVFPLFQSTKQVRTMTIFIHSFNVFGLLILLFIKGLSVLSFLRVRYFVILLIHKYNTSKFVISEIDILLNFNFWRYSINYGNKCRCLCGIMIIFVSNHFELVRVINLHVACVEC